MAVLPAAVRGGDLVLDDFTGNIMTSNVTVSAVLSPPTAAAWGLLRTTSVDGDATYGVENGEIRLFGSGGCMLIDYRFLPPLKGAVNGADVVSAMGLTRHQLSSLALVLELCTGAGAADNAAVDIAIVMGDGSVAAADGLPLILPLGRDVSVEISLPLPEVRIRRAFGLLSKAPDMSNVSAVRIAVKPADGAGNSSARLKSLKFGLR